MIALFGAVGGGRDARPTPPSPTAGSRSCTAAWPLLRRNVLARLVFSPGAPAPSGKRRARPLNRSCGDSEEVVESVDAWIDMVGRTVFVVGAVRVMARIDADLTLVVLLPADGDRHGGAHGRGAARALPPGQTREASGQVTGFLGEVFGAAQAVQVAGATPRAVRHLREPGRAPAPPGCYATAASTQLLEAFNWQRGAPGHRGDPAAGRPAPCAAALHRGRLRPVRLPTWTR